MLLYTLCSEVAGILVFLGSVILSPTTTFMGSVLAYYQLPTRMWMDGAKLASLHHPCPALPQPPRRVRRYSTNYYQLQYSTTNYVL